MDEPDHKTQVAFITHQSAKSKSVFQKKIYSSFHADGHIRDGNMFNKIQKLLNSSRAPIESTPLVSVLAKNKRMIKEE